MFRHRGATSSWPGRRIRRLSKSDWGGHAPGPVQRQPNLREFRRWGTLRPNKGLRRSEPSGGMGSFNGRQQKARKGRFGVRVVWTGKSDRKARNTEQSWAPTRIHMASGAAETQAARNAAPAGQTGRAENRDSARPTAAGEATRNAAAGEATGSPRKPQPAPKPAPAAPPPQAKPAAPKPAPQAKRPEPPKAAAKTAPTPPAPGTAGTKARAAETGREAGPVGAACRRRTNRARSWPRRWSCRSSTGSSRKRRARAAR